MVKARRLKLAQNATPYQYILCKKQFEIAYLVQKLGLLISNVMNIGGTLAHSLSHSVAH